MNEWAVVGVIISLVTFFIAISKPLISLTKAITELTVAVGNLQDKAKTHEKDSHEAHRLLWKHNDEQDSKIERNKVKLAEHEIKIEQLEKAKGGGGK